MTRRVAIAALASAVVAGCAGTDDLNVRADPLWTTGQAESVTVVRGLPVRVRYCLGRGARAGGADAPRYRRFRCVAGGRAALDRYGVDTVAVHYVLHPLGEYEGAGSPHRLSNVRFIGGPGIP